jgi:hypothetical protein
MYTYMESSATFIFVDMKAGDLVVLDTYERVGGNIVDMYRCCLVVTLLCFAVGTAMLHLHLQ